MDERILQALDDADAAIERHLRGRHDADDARRAINEVIGAIYRAFSGLKDRTGSWNAANSSLEGKTMQALIYVRGKAEHSLIKAHEVEVLFPGHDDGAPCGICACC